ncbi:MAG: ATP-binding protein, partial [Candidatus Binatia bacterium]
LDATVADLNTTLSDLLIFSRDFALHLDFCSLESLLDEISEEMQAVAAPRHVDVVYRREEGTAPLLLDRIKLKQALLNLLTNALEASPPTSRVEVLLHSQQDTVQIAVKDQGPGIPAADMEQVFAPFFSTKERGTGLGLPFAQKIVELHKGVLSVSNNPEGGATFLVEIPRRRPAQES